MHRELVKGTGAWQQPTGIPNCQLLSKGKQCNQKSLTDAITCFASVMDRSGSEVHEG